ncbi:MAG TPA: hypothetical protein VG649_02285 [Candidatus Angelobacter sp.]|jgi:hypothetical protein|nr:hypothetical protein [Candidatus Angelobacter sp.]
MPDMSDTPKKPKSAGRVSFRVTNENKLEVTVTKNTAMFKRILKVSKALIYPLAGIGLGALLFSVISVLSHSMRPHFFNLFVRSWDAMVRATGTTTLGFIVWTLALSAVGWAATVAGRWLELKRENTVNPFRKALFSSLWPGVFLAGGVFGLVLCAVVVFMFITIFDDHQILVKANSEFRQNTGNSISDLNKRIKDLESSVEKKKQSVDTSDAVFGNLNSLMYAFASYRHAIGGVDSHCQIKITAPKENQLFASSIAQFSVPVSNCNTFGPLDSSMNPDVEKETMQGMVPDVIVFHAARDDKAANELFARLSNVVRLKRSYDIPANSPEHFIWMQFGTRVKWNTQLQ